MARPEDDAKLVRKAAACSDRAVEELMARHRRLTDLTIRRYADTPEDRSDLRQDVMVVLLERGKKALKAWRPIASFAAYMATIASRRGLRFAKTAARLRSRETPALPSDERELFAEVALQEITDDAPDPLQHLEDSERRAAIASAIVGLSERDRLVIRLRFFEELDGPGLGRVLGISHGAARKAIFDAVRRLREALGELDAPAPA